MLDLSPRMWLQPMLAGIAVTAALLGGCAGPDKTDGQTEPPTIADADAAPGTDAGTEADDDVTSSTQAMADRLAEAMRQSWEPPVDDLTPEQWEQIRLRQQAERDAAKAESDDPTDEANAASEVDVDEAQDLPAEPSLAEVDEPEPLTQREVLALLREHIRGSDDSAMSKALTAAAVSLADSGQEIDPAVLGPLTEPQRARVELFHQLLLTLGQELAQGGELQRHSIDRRLDELFRDRPLEIRTLALCRRVSGFGVFDAFESKTFLAGRNQRLIVYSELEHFRPKRLDNGEYEVQLEQEVVLYNESDGLAVWRHDSVRITDQSQNQRRDFFVVQMVTLPARLSVGKYRMKVRITDLHGDSLDETTVPVELVADESLVQGAER